MPTSLTDNTPKCRSWDKFFKKQHYSLEMINDPDVGVYKAEIKQTPQAVAEKYADFDEWQLVQATHEFPEWINNDPGASSKRIPLREILEALGKGAEALFILEEATEMANMHDLLGK